MRIKYLYSRILILTLPALSISCKKFVTVNPPVTQITSVTAFSTDQSAVSAVAGLYSQIMSNGGGFLNGATTLYPSLTADELILNAPDAQVGPFQDNAIPSTSSIIETNFWKFAYNYIYQANATIEQLQLSTGVTKSVKLNLIAEMEFMRALNYFYLVNLFGDVPLVLSTDYAATANLPRTASTQVYQQIIADLSDAAANLPVDYPNGSPTRPNQLAAVALLARVYLYLQQWSSAESASSVVINSGTYALVSDLDSVFLAGSLEAILQFAPVSPYSDTYDGIIFNPQPSIQPTYSIAQTLLNTFEANDFRMIHWINTDSISGIAYTYPYKYKVGYAATISEYYMVLRLAEQYLIRAEAEAQQNELGAATIDLNMIRNRANLPNLLPATANSQTGLLTAIMHERQVELFTEFGHRWLDLKRTGLADAILGAEKTSWTPTDTLYPIPFSEIKSNSNLVQNPGY